MAHMRVQAKNETMPLEVNLRTCVAVEQGQVVAGLRHFRGLLPLGLLLDLQCVLSGPWTTSKL